jgi:hypothetical protein
LIVVLAVAAQAAAEPDKGPWTDVSENLFRLQYPDFEVKREQLLKNKWRYNAKTSSIAVDRLSGRLFAAINYGKVYSSEDCGETWSPLAQGQPQGRAFEGWQIQLDPLRPDRLAVFRIVDAPRRRELGGTKTSGMTLDGGRTWLPFTDPTTGDGQRTTGNRKGHDGWTYGMVDWSEDRPQTIVAKQHHSSNLWASRDGGESWSIVRRGSPKFGLVGKDRLLSVDSNDKGISLSKDWGRTWVRRTDFAGNARIPVVLGGTVYWCAVEGLLISKDRGESWTLLRTPFTDLLYGPYFGKDESAMLIISSQGFHVTHDSGATWRTVAPFRIIEDGWNDGRQTPDCHGYSFGWDWRTGLIYAACVGGSIYRLESKDTTSGQ